MPATITDPPTATRPPDKRPPPDTEPLLTPAEVATMLRVDTKTVTRWAQAGKLNSIRTLGGHRRYRETEIRALLDWPTPVYDPYTAVPNDVVIHYGGRDNGAAVFTFEPDGADDPAPWWVTQTGTPGRWVGYDDVPVGVVLVARNGRQP